MSSSQYTSSGSAVPPFSSLLNALGQTNNLDEAIPHIASPSWNSRVLQSPAYSPPPYVPTEELSPFLLPPVQQVASTSFSFPPSHPHLGGHHQRPSSTVSPHQIPVIDLSPSPPHRTIKKPQSAANIRHKNCRR